jgi:heme exporter protein D
MAFESFADFLAMGKHGPYVWAAYGVSFAIVLWNAVQPWRQRRKWLHEQAGALKREARENRP